MSPEKEQELVVKFPSLFAGRTVNLKSSLMGFGCECDDGWFGILHSLCGTIEQHIKNGHWKHNEPYRFMQIKEKYGGLSVYDHGSNDFIDGAIRVAETMSYVTCEICGSPGRLCCAAGGYWLKTLCRQHMEEMSYRRVENSESV